jgi:hypothetical protein
MDAQAQTPAPKKLGKKAESLARRAYRQLLWECYAPVLALGVLLLSLFVIGAAGGIWQFIGDPWRLIFLFIALGFLSRSIIRAQRKLIPTRSEALRRIEEDSGLLHRPFDAIVDTEAATNVESLAWRTHVSKAKSNVENARSSKLRAVLAPIDKYYLRFIAPCALVLALMVGGGDNYERLRASFMPIWQPGISAKNARYEAWVDPPEYTGRPPSYFKGEKELTAPEGSEFVARISGVKKAPRLILQDGKRTRRITPKRLGPKSFEARAIVSKSVTASYRIGTETQDWKLSVLQDTHPIIEFDEPPKAGKRDKLIFTYNLSDDFGVEALSMLIALEDAPDLKDSIDVLLPGSSVRDAQKEPASLDLTKHKWAGKQVIGYLSAVDGKNQVGTSKQAIFVVPDKIFVEPLAKSVAEHRSLMLIGTDPYQSLKVNEFKGEETPVFAVDRPDYTIERAPAPVQRAALLIEAATDKPVGIFEDPTVYMGLRNIYRRLQTARNQHALAGIPEDLWKIALRAEFGILGDALADMQAAERALNNAMARRAPQREVDALFERYNNAVDRYMDELMQKAVEEAKKNAGGDQQGGGGGEGINTDEIQALLDAIEEANRIGDTVAARKALAKLAQLLENMQIQLAQGGGGSGEGLGDGMSEELKEALEELNELLGEQRQLRDETQEAQRGQSPQGGQNGQSEQQGEGQAPGAQSGESLAENQESLRELLETLEDGAGKELLERNGAGTGQEGDEEGEGGGNGRIDEALENAKRGMRQSEEALKNSDFYGAGEAQSDAIEALRQLGEELYAEEAKKLGERNADGSQSGDGENADPFGRENDGNGVGDEVEVPEIDDRQRARDLLEELRRRSGEQDRDKIERDYLDRLLERF